MAETIIMPKQGLQMTEGTIIEWRKAEGEQVTEGETLFEIETDKLNIEIDALATGTLLKIIHAEGDTVPITEVIGIIGEPGEDISALLADPGETAVEEEPVAEKSAGKASTSVPASVTRAPGERVFITPRARKIAEERSIPYEQIAGSGPDGVIIERDVKAWQPEAQPASTPLARKLAASGDVDLKALSGSGPRGKIYSSDLLQPAKQQRVAASTEQPVSVTPLKGMRKVIAERMRSSLDTAAQAVHRIEIDMSEAVRIREAFKAADKKISYNDIILKAVAAALAQTPQVNRQLHAGEQGPEVHQYSDINIGIAVALDEGLIVPVLHNADALNLEALRDETRRLAAAAREGALQPDELSEGRFTVSNLGMYDIDSFTAIINEPESCILAVGAVKEKAVVVDHEVRVRPVCNFSLTYDHRIIDGAPAAEFLQRLKALLVNPYLLI